MNILVTNDDGIQAPGIQHLMDCLPDWAQVVAAAPAHEKSACGHSISLHAQLKVEVFERKGKKCYVVHGTPADSVKFALAEISGFKPDLVLSGINQGANTGVSVYYSGTISAAREALINGVPAVAISLASKTYQDFRAGAKIARLLVEVYAQGIFPRHTMLNVNVPPLSWEEIRGIKVTKQAASRFIEEFVPVEEGKAHQIFTLAGEIELFDADGTSDEEAVSEGFVSVTPLKLDLTDYEAMSSLKEWLNGLK